MHAGMHEVVAEASKDIGLDLTLAVERSHQIGKHAGETGFHLAVSLLRARFGDLLTKLSQIVAPSANINPS